MNKKTLGILLMIPLSLFEILIVGVVMYLMIMEIPFVMLGIFIIVVMTLMYIKGNELAKPARGSKNTHLKMGCMMNMIYEMKVIRRLKKNDS